jgi:hypothetical protein
MSDDQTERLIEALHAQTQAIQALADSNIAVVDLLIGREAEEADDDAPPKTYLDGTPIDDRTFGD